MTNYSRPRPRDRHGKLSRRTLERHRRTACGRRHRHRTVTAQPAPLGVDGGTRGSCKEDRWGRLL